MRRAHVTFTCAFVCVCVCECVCVCKCERAWVPVCVFFSYCSVFGGCFGFNVFIIHRPSGFRRSHKIQRGRETDRQTQRERERGGDRDLRPRLLLYREPKVNLAIGAIGSGQRPLSFEDRRPQQEDQQIDSSDPFDALNAGGKYGTQSPWLYAGKSCGIAGFLSCIILFHNTKYIMLVSFPISVIF